MSSRLMITILRKLALQSSASFSYDDLKRYPSEYVELLKDINALRKVGTVSRIKCENCHSGHDVEWLDLEGCPSTPYYDCTERDIPRVWLKPEQLQNWTITFDDFARCLALSLNEHKNIQTYTRSNVHKLGTSFIGGANRDIFLVRGMGQFSGITAEGDITAGCNNLAGSVIIAISDSVSCVSNQNAYIVLLASDVCQLDDVGLCLDIEAINSQHKTISTKERLLHSDDFLWVKRTRDDREFKLSKLRAYVIKRLYELWLVNVKSVNSETLLKDNPFNTGSSISDIFRGSNAWNELIKSDGTGYYSLDI